MRALLDINVLLALRDSAHAFHRTAALWLHQHRTEGFATCPLTQNGAVRILSQASYAHPLPMHDAFAYMQAFCALPAHAFWPDDISLYDQARFHHPDIHGHRQLTDIYLLALAVKHQGRFVTFDQRIPLSAVVGASKKHLVRI